MTEARREAILAAAKAVFEEVGFEQATMSEITARVGGSKATLYRYFESKEALFVELVRRSAREHGGELMGMLHPCGEAAETGLPPEATEVLALLDPDADVKATLQGFGEHVIKNFLTPQKMAAKRMVIAAAGSHPELGRVFYETGVRRGMQFVERYFEHLIKAGKLREANPRVVAAHFRGLLESEWTEPALFNVQLQLSDAQAVAVVQQAVDAFIRAYGPLPA